MTLFRPSVVARRFLDEIRRTVEATSEPVKLVGLLVKSATPPSRKYAKYTRLACENVGLVYEQREMPRLKLEHELQQANTDPNVHGIMIYYPVFGIQQDTTLKNLIEPSKDVEGLSDYWLRRLYAERATVGPEKHKAIRPCTPLAVLKILTHLQCFDGLGRIDKTITIFNRSEVVGRPLATMLAHDGARVYSFDIDGPLLYSGSSVEESKIDRSAALRESSIVISGVPDRRFKLIHKAELRDDCICINVASIKNFDPQLRYQIPHFVAKAGQVTVAMCLRNTLRLYENYHRSQSS